MLDPDSSISILVLVVLLVVHAFFAAAREAIVSLRKSRRLQLIEEGHASAQLIDNIAEDAICLLATEQLVLKFLGFSIVAHSVFIYTDFLTQTLPVNSFVAVLIITVITIFVTLLFGELIPKEIARAYPEPLALRMVYPFSWVAFLAAPLSKLVFSIGRFLTGRWHDSEDDSFGIITEEDLRTYVDASEEGGVLKEAEKEMIYSIFDLDDTIAREIMVPRIDMVAVSADEPLHAVMGKIVQAGYSRVPVYVDNVDNVTGILYVKDLLVHWLDDKAQPHSVRNLVREVYYVPETKPASDLLRELQAKKVHIAIVVDEYGGTAGLVTIEDILEEIVGEIQDEHDADEFYMQHISDNEYIFSALMDLDDINDMMSIELPTDENDTLGGLIYNMFDRIPKTGDFLSGESFGSPELHFTVLDVDGQRIKTVKIQRIKKGSNRSESLEPATDEGLSPLIRNIPNTVSESS